jgi:HEXXH motif-containing protein
MTSEQLDHLALNTSASAALQELGSAERSRRMLALRLLLRLVREQPASCGPLEAADEAWNVLIRAQREAPAEISAMLSDPQLGLWTAQALRRLRGSVESDAAPVWFHVGQLHAFACAAAIRAAVPFRLSVPVWAGNVVLPTLGFAHLGGSVQWETAQVVSDVNGPRIESAAATVMVGPNNAGWRDFHHFRRAGLDLRLEDAAPHCGLTGLQPPQPLTDGESARWLGLLDDAWQLLCRGHEVWARELSVGLFSIVPRPAAYRFRPHSASVGDGFGCAIVSAPHDATQLAATLVHEFQHSKLSAIGHLQPLFDEDSTRDAYSPWRDDPRPTGGLLQGVYAFVAVMEFWEQERHGLRGRDRDLADFEFALLREQARTAIGELKGRRSLTTAGRRFAAGIETRFAQHCSAAVPANLLGAAVRTAADHRIGWRVRHVRPDADLVRSAVQAWAPGRAMPSIENRHQRLDVKAVLARVLLADPAGLTETRGLLGSTEQVVEGAGEGDFAFVAGDLKDAHDLYLKELSGPCDRPGAWSGLALVLDELAPGPAARVLVERPELVSAAHAAIVRVTGEAPDPEALAGWFADRQN